MANPNKAIVGTKVGMTQLWDDNGKVVPVTVVSVPPMRVTGKKSPESDGYGAISVTAGVGKASRMSKPVLGQYAKSEVEPGKFLMELRLNDVSSYDIGQEFNVGVFEAGEKVDVTAKSKGKGHTGVMKRHNFSGQGAGHGNSAKHRAPGSIGACATPGRVFKGTKMAGRVGNEKVTTLGLSVVKADSDAGLILIKGAVPGPRGGTVVVRSAVKSKPGAVSK